MSEMKKIRLSTGDEVGYIERDGKVWFCSTDLQKLAEQKSESVIKVDRIPPKYVLRLKEFSKRNCGFGLPFLDTMGVRVFLWRARSEFDAIGVLGLFEREVFPKLAPKLALNCFVPKAATFPKTVDEIPPDVTAARLRQLANDLETREVEQLKRQQQARTYIVGDIAREFQWSANFLNSLLAERGIQKKDDDKLWHLTEQFEGKGLTDYVKKPQFTMMVWTEKGRQFVRDEVKNFLSREIKLNL